MRKIGKKVLGYLDRLIQSDSRESSKRAIALFITLIIGVIVVLYTNPANLLLVLGELIFFVTSLLYIATNGKLPKIWKDEDNR